MSRHLTIWPKQTFRKRRKIFVVCERVFVGTLLAVFSCTSQEQVIFLDNS